MVFTLEERGFTIMSAPDLTIKIALLLADIRKATKAAQERAITPRTDIVLLMHRAGK